MRAAAIASVVAFLAASPAAAQQPASPKAKAPDTWVSGWVGALHDPGRVSDDATDSYWDFGMAVGAGLGVHRRVGAGLALGVEASYAPARFERTTPRTSDSPVEGDAGFATALASARLLYGGGDAFSMYLAGGAGAVAYAMPADAGGWDPDPALLTGAGLDYRFAPDKSAFVEWGRYWTFHQHEGVKSNSARHGALRAGMRFGW